MKWAFSLSEDRIQTIRHVHGRRQAEMSASSRSGPLRDQALFASPHLPMGPGGDSGLQGQDAFEHYYYQSPTNPQPTQPITGRYAVPNSTNPRAGGPSTRAGPSLDHRISAPNWDTAWLAPASSTSVNEVPASKFGRVSPDELEMHHIQQHSPPSASIHSATSSTEFIQPPSSQHHISSVSNTDNYRPVIRQNTTDTRNRVPTYNAWPSTDLHTHHRSNTADFDPNTFIPIESAQVGGADVYPTSHSDTYQSANHELHSSVHSYVSRAPEATSFGSHQASDMVYMTTDPSQLNRTRLHSDIEPGLYTS
jgi:hypothetical protein